MKKIIPFLILTTIVSLSFVSCKKQDPKSLTTYSYTLSKGQCIASANGNNFTICFDLLITDSRCPTNASCIWQGIAVARFSFHQNGTVIPFSLGTATVATYRQDTTINQISISLKDILPYPNILNPSPAPIQTIIDVRE